MRVCVAAAAAFSVADAQQALGCVNWKDGKESHGWQPRAAAVEVASASAGQRTFTYSELMRKKMVALCHHKAPHLFPEFQPSP